MKPLFIKAVSRPNTYTPTVRVTRESDAGSEGKKARDGQSADTARFAGVLAMLAEHRPGAQFGPHNVEKGAQVAFRAGTFVGAGKAVAVGKDGLTVQDDEARDHRVHWHEVTGHAGAKKQDKDGDGA